jgi:hypothetical protein
MRDPVLHLRSARNAALLGLGPVAVDLCLALFNEVPISGIAGISIPGIAGISGMAGYSGMETCGMFIAGNSGSSGI